MQQPSIKCVGSCPLVAGGGTSLAIETEALGTRLVWRSATGVRRALVANAGKCKEMRFKIPSTLYAVLSSTKLAKTMVKGQRQRCEGEKLSNSSKQRSRRSKQGVARRRYRDRNCMRQAKRAAEQLLPATGCTRRCVRRCGAQQSRRAAAARYRLRASSIVLGSPPIAEALLYSCGCCVRSR